MPAADQRPARALGEREQRSSARGRARRALPSSGVGERLEVGRLADDRDLARAGAPVGSSAASMSSASVVGEPAERDERDPAAAQASVDQRRGDAGG